MELTLFDIYVFNLLVTMAMFIVLMLRAWIELKNYRLIWKEMEWRKTYGIMGRVLKTEKDVFTHVEGGRELYEHLCKVFGIKEEAVVETKT